MRPPHRAFPPPPMRVLVADDDAGARAALRELLRVWGHEVSEAADAEEAVTAAAAFRPDVLMVDGELAGAAGLPARLRALPGLEGVAVVVMAEGGAEETLRAAQEAGVRHRLCKPADPVLLRRVLGAIRYGDEG